MALLSILLQPLKTWVSFAITTYGTPSVTSISNLPFFDHNTRCVQLTAALFYLHQDLQSISCLAYYVFIFPLPLMFSLSCLPDL